MKILRIIPVVFMVMLVGCNPDYVKVDLYTSDFSDSLEGKIINVPLEMKFSGHLGDEKDDVVQRIIQLSKKYLGADTEYTRSKGDFGDEVIIVKSQAPMGPSSSLKVFLTKRENSNLPLGLSIDRKEFSIKLVTTEALGRFNQELAAINFMLSIDMIPKTLTYNVVSDEKLRYQVVGYAAFVNEKPHLKFMQTLDRRESVAVDFSGGDGSIWKGDELRPSVSIIPESMK